MPGNRCLFCGQGSAQLEYRCKSPARAALELAELGRAHPASPLIVTDEVISPDYFRSFLPEAARLGLGDRIVYFEVRPDLTREQLGRLRQAGVRRVEAGVESLSTPVLGLVHKGVTALQCLQFLKWCRELGLTVVWNWLWGFPGEPAPEYQRLARGLERLFHLAPPNYAGPFRLDRFSPYFENPRKHQLEGIAPLPGLPLCLPPAAGGPGAPGLLLHLPDRPAPPGRGPLHRAPCGADRPLEGGLSGGQPGLRGRGRPAGHPGPGANRAGKPRTRPSTDPTACSTWPATGPRARPSCPFSCRRHAGSRRRRTPVRSLLAPLVEQGWMVREGDGYLSLACRRQPVAETA